jgi:hypothetical protein
LLAGSIAAALARLPARVAATVTSFGGGVLLAAVALELVPEADEEAGSWVTAAGLVAGTLAFVAADSWLSRRDAAEAMRRSAHAAAAGRSMDMPPSHSEAARGEAIAIGLVVDGVPESVAVGLTSAEGEIGLALLVGVLVGNLVEAYGAAQPILAGGHTRRFAIGAAGRHRTRAGTGDRARRDDPRRRRPHTRRRRAGGCGRSGPRRGDDLDRPVRVRRGEHARRHGDGARLRRRLRAQLRIRRAGRDGA